MLAGNSPNSFMSQKMVSKAICRARNLILAIKEGISKEGFY